MLFVLDEVDSLNDVGVVQSGRDTEFRSELLDVFLFRLVLSSLSEFLQRTRWVECNVSFDSPEELSFSQDSP
jgi:hypothetical protein